ncbi:MULTISPECIES: hypothetical protein [Halorussus]|uniref:hypothetical protein n=1 Tax=Halorussus TaxID=1070314 RepID=UPI0020A14FCF|nr:hypothetical protein [Halorussus vallis]USZ76607.1 hypothetical protein NGM07_04590 [Halorussus vallis]
MDTSRVLVGSVCVLLGLSYLVYLDARRRGSEHAHLYGIAMIPTNVVGPLGFVLYFYFRKRIGNEVNERRHP